MPGEISETTIGTDPVGEALKRATNGGFNTRPMPHKLSRPWRHGTTPLHPDYYVALAARKVVTTMPQRVIQRSSDLVAKQNLLVLVAISILIGVSFGFASGCHGLAIDEECGDVFEELRLPLRITGQDPHSLGAATKLHVEHNTITGPSFNARFFSGWLFFAAFVLAFTRWQIGNAQAAMSEIFERKRTSNMLIIDNHAETKDLVSGAINIREHHPDNRTRKIQFTQEDCLTLFRQFEENPWGAGACSPTFIQQMFVYMELDNLEFAHMKFRAGYLAPEQMYRACEIFESRCQSKFFRYVAVRQGLHYYTALFHDLVVATIIFGYAASDDNRS
jgi:hypothetical protein